MINDLSILKAKILHDDNTLVRMYYKSFNNFKTKKKTFDKEINNYDENSYDGTNYLSVAVAKLAYAFAKEEYDLLSSEAKERGLIV